MFKKMLWVEGNTPGLCEQSTGKAHLWSFTPWPHSFQFSSNHFFITHGSQTQFPASGIHSIKCLLLLRVRAHKNFIHNLAKLNYFIFIVPPASCSIPGLHEWDTWRIHCGLFISGITITWARWKCTLHFHQKIQSMVWSVSWPWFWFLDFIKITKYWEAEHIQMHSLASSNRILFF